MALAFRLMFKAKHFSEAALLSNWFSFLHALLALAGLLVFSMLAGRRACLILPGLRKHEGTDVLRFASGLGLLAGVVLALGLNGLLFAPPPAISLGLLLLPVALNAGKIRGNPGGVPHVMEDFHAGPPSRALKIMLAAAALMVAAGAFSIEVGWDALMYHLRLPSFYAYHHKIYDVWHNYCSAFPANIEILYTLCMLAQGETLARLLNTAFGFLLLFAGRQLARETGLNGRWTTVLLGACPLILVLMTRAYIDLGFAFFLTVSFLCLIRWWKAGSAMELVASGLCAGWGAGSKYVVAVYLVSAVAVLAGRPGTPRARAVAVWGGSALLPFAPWLAKNLFFRGNPVDPFLGGLFGKTGAVPPEIKPFFEDGGSFMAMLGSLPERVDALFLNHGHVFGPLIPALAGLLPLMLFSPARGPLIPVKRFVIAYTALWCLMTYDVRYYLPALPALCVLGEALLAETCREPRATRVITRILAEAGMFLGLAYGSTVILQNSLPLSMPLGFDTMQSKLRQGLTPPPFASFTRSFVNTRLPKSARVLYVCQHSTWYFDRECMADYHYWESNLTRIISAGKTEAGIARRFRQLGINWILSTTGRIESYEKIPGYFDVPPDGWVRFKSFLETRCEVAWQTDFQVIFHIGRPHPPKRLASLPVFEDLYFRDADIALRKDRPADALRLYSSPHPLLRNVGSTYMRRAAARMALGDFTAGEADFRSALSTGMDIPDVHLGLAVALYNQGRLLEALPHVLRTLELNPYSPQASGLLGRIRNSLN